MFSLLGFLSDIGLKSGNGQAVDDMYYDYVSNSFIEKERRLKIYLKKLGLKTFQI